MKRRKHETDGVQKGRHRNRFEDYDDFDFDREEFSTRYNHRFEDDDMNLADELEDRMETERWRAGIAPERSPRWRAFMADLSEEDA